MSERSRVANQQDAALGRFQGLIERSSNFLAQAVQHNLARNVRVLKLLAYLGWLRKSGVKMDGPVTCDAAILQNFSSTMPMEAAHFLPGQLRVGGTPVWMLATNPRVRAQMQFLFAEVEHLPAPFNHADSEAESKSSNRGLCSALSSAAALVIRGPLTGSDWLRQGYEEWQKQALEALRLAQLNKASKPGVPPLQGSAIEGYTPESIAARSAVGATEWNREESARILGYYLADQQLRTWSWAASSCRQALNEVEQAFK